MFLHAECSQVTSKQIHFKAKFSCLVDNCALPLTEMRQMPCAGIDNFQRIHVRRKAKKSRKVSLSYKRTGMFLTRPREGADLSAATLVAYEIRPISK